MGRKSTNINSQLAPALNVALIGQLNVYVVHEHELDQIAEGSPANLAFNGAVAFLSLAAALLLTVTTTTISKPWLFYTYLFLCINFSLAGVILLVYWWVKGTSTREVVRSIKGRMSPSPGVQEAMPPDPQIVNPPTH